MFSPSDLGLPYTEWRPSQWEAIEFTLDSPKRIVLLEMPTGTGKSGVLIALHRLTGQRMLILTATKQLQRQYVEVFGKDLKVITGRANYHCPRHPRTGLTAADCTHSREYPCPLKMTRCPYEQAKQEALRAPLALLNMAYFVHETLWVGQFVNGEPWIGVDECDLLENELLSAIEFHLTPYQIRMLGDIDPPQFKTKEESWKSWAGEAINALSARISRLSLDETQDIKEFNQLRRLQQKLRWFKDAPGQWVFIQNEQGWTGKPVWASPFGPLIFKHGERVICTSATILSQVQFCKNLGIPQADTAFARYPMSFPVENRLIQYVPSGDMSLASRKEDLPKLLRVLDEIMDEHSRTKGLILSYTFGIADYIMSHSSHPDRLLTHNSQDRQAIVDIFKANPLPFALVSPSLYRGIDLPYDQARWLVWCRLPRADLSDPVVSRRFFQDRRSYDWWTVRDLVQGCGRIVRAPDDKGCSYILDEAFAAFYQNPQVKEMFPGWFRQALIGI